MRLTVETAKLRLSMGVETAVGRMATAGRRNLEAMAAVVVVCVAGEWELSWAVCEVYGKGRLGDSIDQLEGWLVCVTDAGRFQERAETADD